MLVANRGEVAIGGIRAGKHQGSKLWDDGQDSQGAQKAGKGACPNIFDREVVNVCHG